MHKSKAEGGAWLRSVVRAARPAASPLRLGAPKQPKAVFEPPHAAEGREAAGRGPCATAQQGFGLVPSGRRAPWPQGTRPAVHHTWSVVLMDWFCPIFRGLPFLTWRWWLRISGDFESLDEYETFVSCKIGFFLQTQKYQWIAFALA